MTLSPEERAELAMLVRSLRHWIEWASGEYGNPEHPDEDPEYQKTWVWTGKLEDPTTLT